MRRRAHGIVDPLETRRGVMYGLLAYGFWGFIAVYFKAVSAAAPLEVLAHRMAWSAVFLAAFAVARGRGPDLGAALRDRRTLVTLSTTALLISLNWYVFIWAVTHDRLLQASLGYFINPLVNVLLGFVFLGERLRRAQIASVILAGTGVTWLGVHIGQVPYIALTLAFSFGFYGLLRKRARADALVGLTLETLLLFAPAVAYLCRLNATGRLAFLHHDTGLDLLLVAAGLVTAAPLLWFANAARRLRLATVGFLQYMSPSFQLMLAVVAYGEPFSSAHRVAFACIWTALALYTLDAWRFGRIAASAERHEQDSREGQAARQQLAPRE